MRRYFLPVAFYLCTQMLQAQLTVQLEPYASGFTNDITDMAFAPDGRLYVADQTGYIRLYTGGTLVSKLFLDIHDKVTFGGEQGLLGITFSPNYLSNGYFYVNYTNTTDTGNTIIARYRVSNNPDSADANSEQVLLEVEQPYRNHNGGCMKFGDDGYLYIAMGDGGSKGDPANRAQNLDSLLGKMLRIDVSGNGSYTIPQSNPYVGISGRNEIWASGLRNPWRFSFDRLTHGLWIADVGQDTLEEINFQPVSSNGGENYGWRCYEAQWPYNSTGCSAPSNYEMPVYHYFHSNGECSVTGGFVYRGSQYPAMYGHYLFADWCTGDIYALTTDGNFTYKHAGQFQGKFFTTFGEDNNGELYVADNGTHTIYHITTPLNSVTKTPWYGLTVFPVPSTDILNCRFTETGSGHITLSLSNCLGQVVHTNTYNMNTTNTVQLNIAAYPAGLYTLHYTSPTGEGGFATIVKK